MLNVKLGLRPCDMPKVPQIIREATQHSTFNIQHYYLFIRLFMNSRHGSAAWVVLILE